MCSTVSGAKTTATSGPAGGGGGGGAKGGGGAQLGGLFFLLAQNVDFHFQRGQRRGAARFRAIYPFHTYLPLLLLYLYIVV
mgnify:CR=1 FL=1